MFPQHHFNFSRLAALLGVIVLAFPLTAFCMMAGRADFVVGKVEAIAADGTRRTLVKGSEINVGETINTNVGARAQIRFNDGGFISLQPNSLFRVDEFNYQSKADGTEKGFFSLLKGGLRAITGAIGRVNRDTYRVTTPVATIGIRGTGYNAMLSDGLFVNVGEGAISLANNAGLLIVSAGGAAFVANINTPPAPTTEQPQTPPASLNHILYPITNDPTFIAGDVRDASGRPSILSGLGMATGSGYTMDYAYMQCGDGCFGSGSGGLTDVTAHFNGLSQLQQYETTTEGGALGTATVSFAATDGVIGWGRWDGNTEVSPVNGGSPPHPLTNGTFHYVIGIPTATMPTAGTATYNLIGYTTPTATDGTTGWNVSGTLMANFSITTSTSVNLTVENPSLTIPVSYTLNGVLTGTGTTFTTGASPIAVGGGCTTCTASIDGFYAGADASRAGLTYAISDPSTNRNVQGATAFASTGISTTPALSQ